MDTRVASLHAGLDALRALLRALASPPPALANPAPAVDGHRLDGWLLTEILDPSNVVPSMPPQRGSSVRRDAGDPERDRLVALVDLARDGDVDAFGQLYDHYLPIVYRYLLFRVGTPALAEDLAAETFLRALRGLSGFTWQGRDFGAWLTTIARNLALDHFKAGRTRLEQPTEDLTPYGPTAEGPEASVLASWEHQALLEALRSLPPEQQDCLVMRFLQGLTIAETARALSRSEGAVKQLQLRGVRNLARLVPEELR